MVEETICLQCGDRGYENAFVYCIRCLDFAVHRYCLDVVPETFDEFVWWLCDDCNRKERKQSGVLEHDAIPSQTRHHDVPKNIEGFSGNGNKKNGLVVAETNERVREDGSEQTYDACAKFDLIECGESASQHTPVQLDGMNDANAILLPADVNKRSQLEEEKVEGNLMEPVELSAGCLKQKKRIKIKNETKRNIIESTTKKDLPSLATETSDEHVKVDVNECTRSASDSTLPSKVKGNGCSEQKDQTCVSKPFDSITDLGIACVPTDHPVTSRNGTSKILKDDGKGILLPADFSKRFQLEEDKVEGNVIEPIDLSAGCLNQKKTKIKVKKREGNIVGNIVESTAEKDQCRLATASYDECVKVDINKCTRLASDSTLPSEVKEHAFSGHKDQACVSKTCDSITDLGIAVVPSGHPVSSSNGPSRSLKNDTSCILLPEDSKRSNLEEERVEGNLIEPIELSAGCLTQKKRIIKIRIKKRERNISETITEKDQDRLPAASYDESVKVGINKCTRLAIDSTLPSRVKENGFFEQKDQTCLSKPFDSITDLGIAGEPEDHPVISSNKPSMTLENDGNGTFLPADVNTQSHLEEEKIEENLIEPIVSSAGCLKQKKRKIKRKKKRKRNIMESATEKDQHRLAMASYDERVKVDINGCTRSASDATLPSKMKENDCSEQKEQTCVSKPFDSITDLGIVGEPADHPIISSNKPSTSLENDGNGTLLPADVSTQSHLEEEKIEGNLIEPIDLSAGCLKQKKKKIKRMKKRERNIMESATEKDQHRLAMASYDERVKVDINGCTRSASDATLPSKMKENDCSEQKEQTCVSKPFDSIIDLGIAGVPADHPVISSSRPSASLKNDGNGILLPADVSTRSQLEEEKIEGNLMEPIDLSADCLKQKKRKVKRKKNRKRDIMESATEKDQHRLATASYDERVKVDINECTRSASDSTLPSKVKENECVEQNDQLCVSKPIDSITDLGITGVTADHPVILSIEPSMSLENDGNCILLPAGVSTQSQLEERKIEGNLLEPIDLSAGFLKQKKNKIKRKKKRKINIMESTTEKEQHRLATSYDERVKVDINECTRLASDSTLPSKVKEIECSEPKDRTSVSKPFDSIADLGITGVPADHPVISSDEPSRSLKKKKTITSSETIPQEQLHQTSVAQPLRENKDLYLESQCADLSTEERDFRSSNDPVENRGPEEKVERTSTTCQSREACKHYPKDIGFSVAQPIAMPIWRGSFSIQNEKYDNIDLVIAHISNKACHKVYEVASQFQPILHLEMCPKSDIWPKSFQTAEPNDDNIALYFFPSKISEQVFEQLVGEMIHEELAFRAIVQDAELLIFTSTELPLLYWTFRSKYYLWGVFRGNQPSPSNALSSKGEVAEIPKM